MTALEEAAQRFPQGEYREAAKSLFTDELEPLLMPLLRESFQAFVDGLRRVQDRPAASDPEYLARKLVREVIQPRIEPVLALAIREKQLKRLDKKEYFRSLGLEEGADPLLVAVAEIMSEQGPRP
jgi:hypothetical protein